MRLVFWGTSSFAVPSLRALLGEGFDVVGVVTQPDRAVGRSRSTLVPSPVKSVALEEEIPLYQPETPKDESFLAQLRALEPGLSIVVSYGHILSSSLIDLPSFGTINVHASLLPALRGAAPIQGAVRAGLAETGVTVMRMVPALDAGPILLQARTSVARDETAGELEARLSELGALALVEALTLMSLGKLTETPQDDSKATSAPKILREMARIDWSESAEAVGRHVRAYDPKPGAFTTHRGGEIKLFGAVVTDATAHHAHAPGTVVSIDASGMLIACGTRYVLITCAQPAGRKRIDPETWMRGRGIEVGERFGG
ncbi:MAG: methionyl-tRNA formyltransferase [Gemmatimonadaceae bacterium]|nr:methionyl-tRNA formyltransferase [Gemmatimonadaceae bacterium]